MSDTAAVVLAAGKGTRMRSKYPKVVHSVAGKPMLSHVLDSVGGSGIEEKIIVVGYGKEFLLDTFSGLKYVVQEEQLGTGHAVYQAKDAVEEKYENVLVISGDTPLLTSVTISELIQHHNETHASGTILTADISDPEGYGRIIRDKNGTVKKIVEHKDASENERKVNEINSGTYVFRREVLFEALEQIKPKNVQGEYYLTDVIEYLFDKGLTAAAKKAADSKEILGINDRIQLAEADKLLCERKNRELMLSGVTIISPSTTRIAADVNIGQDAVIYPHCRIEGNTTIGGDCSIGPNTEIIESQIGEAVSIRNSVVFKSKIGSDCSVGPFAYLRAGTELSDSVKIGDFVEVKKSKIGEGSKVPHHIYLGDAEIGKNVNVGAGTITCNYDGENKWRTLIHDGAFIGSNVNLVAPVEIGKGAYIAAGSTISEDVPEDALGIARGRQKNFEDWVTRKKKRKNTSKNS